MLLKALVNIFSSDILRAAEFYGGLLGLEESYRFPYEGTPEHIEYLVGTTTVAISSPEGLAAHGMPAPTPGHPFELGFKVDDVDALIESLRGRATILKEPFDIAAGNRVAYLADPDGTWIAVYHNLSKG